MTDIMKLADDYAEEYSAAMVPQLKPAVQEARTALQSDIEALQAEVAQVKGFWKEAQLRNRNLLEEGNDLAMLADQYKAERDQLQAKLDELGKQEPVALEDEMLDAAFSWCDSNGINVLEPEQLSSLVNSLYITVRDAAPKALEPEPLIKFRHGCKWCGKAKCAAGCYGITKGTPT